jgi:hypothetical protein
LSGPRLTGGRVVDTGELCKPVAVESGGADGYHCINKTLPKLTLILYNCSSTAEQNQSTMEF